MDVADPLGPVSSKTCLLHRTLGSPAPGTFPSKGDEALLRGVSESLKGSKELMEQSKTVVKDYGDIRMVYHDDGGKALSAANCRNDQLGRRPAGERKRHRFTMKYPTSKSLPVVDRSVLDTILDPDEYFAKEVQLDEAEEEIRRLKGEVQPLRTMNFDPLVERKKRNSLRPRKSYVFSSDAHPASAIMIPVSQSENMAESHTSQDAAHASVSEENEKSVPSRSDNCAISDSFVEKDSFNDKDKDDEITNIMNSFQKFDGPDKLDFLRKTIGIGEIRMENIYQRDSVLMRLGSTAEINPQGVRNLEGPLPGSYQARISELEKHIFRDATIDKHKKDDGSEGHTLESLLPWSHQARVSDFAEHIIRDTTLDKYTDLLNGDEFEGSPDIVMGEQSLAHDSSDVDLMTVDNFSASEKDREASSLSAKSAEHVSDPEANVSDCATIDNSPCSRHTVSMEENNVPMDYSTIDKSNIEAVISSHHLEDASTEVFTNTPGRNVAPDDIARNSHSPENNIQHQEIVEGDGVLQDKSIHLSEIPPEDIGLQNQSQAPDGTIKKLRDDLGSALSPTNAKTQKEAQQEKTKQRPKKGKKVADESLHSPEIPQAGFGAENQPHVHNVNTEKLTDDQRSALSLSKEKTKKEAQRSKIKQQPKKGKKVSDESLHSPETPQADFGAQNQPCMHNVNTEKLTDDHRSVLSPTKEKTQKAAQRRKTKQQPKMGKKVADESLNSLEISQADLDSEDQSHMHDVNTEQPTVMRNALSPNKPKGQKEAKRRNMAEELNKRKSLADAGMEWQSGVRRSRRIRHRPLDQWLGERFVYGRIHDTMITIVGVKSYSPDEGGKRALKVKSFVPEQYSDIVAQSAKY